MTPQRAASGVDGDYIAYRAGGAMGRRVAVVNVSRRAKRSLVIYGVRVKVLIIHYGWPAG